MTLRDKLTELIEDHGLHYGACSEYDVTRFALAAARLALTEYAEKMERAGQPAAVLGAVLMAEQLHERAEASTLGADR